MTTTFQLPEVSRLLTLLSKDRDEFEGRTFNYFDYFNFLQQLYQYLPIRSIEPLLPLMLSFKREPLTLKDHFVFSPLFNLDRPDRIVVMAGRQVGKSVCCGSLLVTTSGCIPGFQSLYVTPLGEQMKRFSINYVKALISTSPCRRILTAGCKQNIDHKEFLNTSKIQFSFASDSADRIRGITADVCYFDELQDFNVSNLPVIESTLSHSDWHLRVYTGTPKTMDNTLTVAWKQSSQAEWWIKCPHCGEQNIPSLDYHLEEMIGDWRPDISEEAPGVVCHKCKKPINPRTGRFVHRYPKRRLEFSGYHIPQILLPHHYAFQDSWKALLDKRDNWPTARYYNEVLGEPYDIGQTLLTQAELMSACCLGIENNQAEPDPKVITAAHNNYLYTALTADWAGGGVDSVSYTVLGLMGLTADGHVDVLWGKRFSGGIEHEFEAQDCLKWVKVFQPNFFVHDYSGAGALRETILIHAGFPYRSTIPIEYTGAHKSNLIVRVPACATHRREHWTLDRTRSLQYTIQCIKNGYLRFFNYDGGAEAKNLAGISTSLLDDFLALTEEKTVSPATGSENYVIRKQASKSDDFAHAINMGLMALWELTGTYPMFASNSQQAYNMSLQDDLYGDYSF